MVVGFKHGYIENNSCYYQDTIDNNNFFINRKKIGFQLIPFIAKEKKHNKHKDIAPEYHAIREKILPERKVVKAKLPYQKDESHSCQKIQNLFMLTPSLQYLSNDYNQKNSFNY